MKDKTITSSEAAKIIGCVQATIRMMILSGRMKGQLKTKGKIKWYETTRKEAERIRDTPQTGRGYPRGKKRT